MGSRAEHLGDLPPDELSLARIFHLVADGHLAAGFEEPPDVAIGRVVGNAAHGHRTTPGERHVQQLGTRLGVLKEHLIKIPEPEQQQSARRQFAFDSAILRHHGRQLCFGGHLIQPGQGRGNRRLGHAFLMSTAKAGKPPQFGGPGGHGRSTGRKGQLMWCGVHATS